MHNIIVHALIENKNGEILIIKRTLIKRGKSNYEGGKWDVPGGTVETLELPVDAVVRETEEEVGLEIKVQNIIFETSNIDIEKNQVFTTLIYLCECNDEDSIKLGLEEHDAYKWMTYDDVLSMKDSEVVFYMKDMIRTLNKYKKIGD